MCMILFPGMVPFGVVECTLYRMSLLDFPECLIMYDRCS